VFFVDGFLNKLNIIYQVEEINEGIKHNIKSTFRSICI